MAAERGIGSEEDLRRQRPPTLSHGTRIGTKYYVCGAAITKGKTVCQPIQFLQRKLDDFVLDFVAQRIDALLGARGRDTLRALIERQLAPSGPDPGPEKNRHKARLKELTTKIDSVIDLMATASADHRELMEDRLGRLLAERKEIEGRLRQLEQVRAKGPTLDALVDAILEVLTDARRLFDHGTMEERKRVIRAFVENLAVDGVNGTGELRTKRIPDAQGIRDSFKVVAGARCEVQQTDRPREIEVIPLTFTGLGTALVSVSGTSIID